jgi:capping protein (actin filament) muscle Z-line, alpha
MVTSKPVAATQVSFSSESDLASAVIAHIKASETALQLGMEDMYSNMSEETIKSLRRTMPITRSKMDWNLNSVRMTRQIRK